MAVGEGMHTASEIRLSPQPVLPTQFDVPRTISPEVGLMLAVLEDALEIHRKYGGLADRHKRRLLADAERWLFSDDTRWPFSFVNVCHTLGFDVGWIRSQLCRAVPATSARTTVRHRCHVVR